MATIMTYILRTVGIIYLILSLGTAGRILLRRVLSRLLQRQLTCHHPLPPSPPNNNCGTLP